MSERTITEAGLKDVLSTTALIIGCPTYNSIIKKAFPPIFEPKKGVAIIASDNADFSNSKIRIFCYINDPDREYVCFCDGHTEEYTTVGFRYAKPLTPTQKGE
jgi:hypothetical protein